jgi:hypothetical protein
MKQIIQEEALGVVQPKTQKQIRRKKMEDFLS